MRWRASARRRPRTSAWLVAFRALQGAGAAIFPLSFGIIRDEFPAHKVGVAIGTMSSVFGIGGGVGLVLSGVIVEHLSWQWLFLIGALPVFVATALIVQLRARVASQDPGQARLPRRRGAVGRLRGAAARAERGHAVGLDVHGVLGADRNRDRGAHRAGSRSSAGSRTRSIDLPTLLRPGMAATNASTVLIGFSMTAFFVLVPGFLQSPELRVRR